MRKLTLSLTAVVLVMGGAGLAYAQKGERGLTNADANGDADGNGNGFARGNAHGNANGGITGIEFADETYGTRF